MEGAGGGGGGFLSLNSSALTPGMMAVLLNSAPRDAWVCECPSLVTLAHVDLTVVLTKDRFEIFSSPTSSWFSAEVLSLLIVGGFDTRSLFLSPSFSLLT